MSLRDQILSANDTETVLLPMPEWGFDVHIRSMSCLERERFENAYQKSPNDSTLARFASIVLADETGARLFTEADVPNLAKKGLKALKRVYDVGEKLNKIEAPAVDEAVKNSEAIPSDSGASDAPTSGA